MTALTAEETTQRRHIARLRDKLGSICDWLEDDMVEDVICNPDGRVWAYVRARGRVSLGALSSETIRSIINTVAAMNDTVANQRRREVEATLPVRGCRFHGLIPPVVDAPAFAIRTRPRSVYSLDEMVRDMVVTDYQKNRILEALRRYKNIVVVGSTGSGKTTFINTCLKEIGRMFPEDRIVTIESESAAELVIESEDFTCLRATLGTTMTQCLRNALRIRPGRVVVGEVRGGEALDMIKAWNTGHPGGLATVHANSAEEGLKRIEDLVREATRAPQRHNIAATVNVLAYIERDKDIAAGRRLKALIEVTGLTQEGKYETRQIA